jgi:hypothetical protein
MFGMGLDGDNDTVCDDVVDTQKINLLGFIYSGPTLYFVFLLQTESRIAVVEVHKVTIHGIEHSPVHSLYRL